MDQAAAERSGPGGSAEGQTVTVDESSETTEAAETERDRIRRGEAVVPRAEQAGPDQAARDWGVGAAPGGFGSAEFGSGEYGSGATGAPDAASPDAGAPEEPAAVPAEPRAPRKWGQWLYAPLVVGWRFALPQKPRPFIVELPFLLAIALELAFVIKTFLVQAFG